MSFVVDVLGAVGRFLFVGAWDQEVSSRVTDVSSADIKKEVAVVKELYQEAVPEGNRAMKFSRSVNKERNFSYSYFVIPREGVYRQLHKKIFIRNDGMIVPSDGRMGNKPGFVGDGGRKTVYRIVGVEKQQDDWTRGVFSQKLFDRHFISCLPKLENSFHFNRAYFIEQLNVEGVARPTVLSKFMPNGDFLEYISDQGTVEASIPKFALDMAKGIEQLHNRRIAHGDIKIENFLVGKDGRLVLSDPDFMCSIDIGVSMNWGTPGYTDPNILLNNATGNLMLKADIFSLGVCMFMLVKNDNFFCEADYRFPGKIFTRADFEAKGFYKESELKSDYERLVYRMCDPDPTMRPDIGEVVQRLEPRSVSCRTNFEQIR